MGIILLDNSNTTFNSYIKGWETSIKLLEEEVRTKPHRERGNHLKKKN